MATCPWRVRTWRPLAIITIFSIAVFGCVQNPDPGTASGFNPGTTDPIATATLPAVATASSAPSELTENMLLWTESGTDSYEFIYTSTCGENDWITFEPVTVAVSDGVPELVDGPEHPVEVGTVAKLFGVIAEAEQGRADQVSVRYGPLGQPLEIFIDYSGSAIDDEFCVSVSEFVVG